MLHPYQRPTQAFVGVNGATLPHAAMLTLSQVAQMLNAHPNTIRRWTNKGLLHAYRVGYRGDRRFTREDVANFLDSWNHNGHNELPDRGHA